MVSTLPSTTAKNAGLFYFFIDRVKELHAVEKQLIKTFARLKNAAGGNELKMIFSVQLEDARKHCTLLEGMYRLPGRKTLAKKTEAIESIALEGERMIENLEGNALAMDLGLTLSSHKLVHYTIPAYAGLKRLSLALGLTEISIVLKKMLDDAKRVDELLTRMAEEEGINEETAVLSHRPETQKIYFPRFLPLRAAGFR